MRKVTGGGVMRYSDLLRSIIGGILMLALSLGCGGRSLGTDIGDSGIKGSGSVTGTAGASESYTGFDGTTGSGIVYNFVGWDASSSSGVYPTSMTFKCANTGITMGNPDVFPVTVTVDNSHVYNGTTDAAEGSFGIRGHGIGGISTLATASASTSCPAPTNGYIAAIDVGPLDLTGLTNARVFFEAAQISDQTREYGLRLQYSTNNGTSFTDAAGPLEFTSGSVGTSTAYRLYGPLTIAALDNQSQVILRWRYYSVTSTSGSRTRIALRNIRVSTDSTAPTFTGAITATASSTSAISLSWPAATDNVSTATYMRYDIYYSLTSGGQNFTQPPALTVRGTTAAEITGLAQGTQYHFVVRARDEQGNTTAATEVNATTAGTACTTVEGLRDQITGTNVAVSCTITDAYVTYVFTNGFTFQKTQGGAALFVFTSSAPAVAVGNRITITGTQGTLFSGLRQLTQTGFTINANDSGSYDVLTNLATTVNDGDTLDANNESKLVRTTQTGNVTALGANENTFRLNGGATDYFIRSGTGTPDMACTGRTFTVTRGVVDRFNTLFRIKSNTADVSLTNLCSFNVTAAASTTNTAATVTFSDAPTAGAGATGAANAGNYKIVGGAGTCGATIGAGDAALIVVSGASLSGNVVTLTTDAQTGSTSYKACVFNVTRNADGAALSTSSFNFTGTAAGGGGNATDLFISEYLEGNSNNKCVEIFNGTGATVNASTYRLVLYGNGSATVTGTTALTTLTSFANNTTYTVCNTSLSGGTGITANLSNSGAINYNGDDHVALQKDTGGGTWVNVDVFGSNIGTDPGTCWLNDGSAASAGCTAGNSTVDTIWRRNATVASPTTTWTASQWSKSSGAADGTIFSNHNFGSHTFTP